MTNSEWVQIRVVTIEQEAVNNMNPTDFPFSEFAAKNIGIRRSYGEFVLATNVDNMASRTPKVHGHCVCGLCVHCVPQRQHRSRGPGRLSPWALSLHWSSDSLLSLALGVWPPAD